MKSISESKNVRLTADTREALNKVLDKSSACVSRGKKLVDTGQSFDSAKRDKCENMKGKQAVEETLADNVLKDRECGNIAFCDDDEMNDSDWEDCLFPSIDIMVDTNVDDTRELTIEFDDVPDAKMQKNFYRATAEDKERAELVHKVHLLCLLARGRIVDNACNDPLIQASLLSLLPSYLSKAANLEKITVKDIAPLLRWVRGNFSIRCTPSSEKSFGTSLAFALESRKGTAEELAALTVALLRALNLRTRFVSILDVASLKPGADKDESSGQNRTKMKHGVFRTSTLMVPKQQANSSYPNKSSFPVEDKNLGERSEPQHENPQGSDQLQENTDNSSCEVGSSSRSHRARRKGDVVFEMQLAMALTATATANNQQSSKVMEKKKSREIKKSSDGSSVSDQVISTAIVQRKWNHLFVGLRCIAAGKTWMGNGSIWMLSMG